MMQHEFEEKYGKIVTPKEWEMISFVYTWHPSISDVNGKKEIVSAFKTDGIDGIKRMIPAAKAVANQQAELETLSRETAKKLQDINDNIWNLESQLLEIKRQIAESRIGYALVEQSANNRKEKILGFDLFS
jgi:pyridoxal/pyridoxine/pyridoxamine kinase